MKMQNFRSEDPDLLLDDLGLDPPAPAVDLGPIPGVMNAEALARLLGVSEPVARSVGVKLPGRARWDVRATVRAYLDRLREHAGRAGRPSVGGDGVKAATERLRAAQAELAEAKAAVARGELVEAAAVTREWANLLRDLRNALLAVPSRCGAALPHLTAADVATVEREIHKALEALANAD